MNGLMLAACLENSRRGGACRGVEGEGVKGTALCFCFSGTGFAEVSYVDLKLETATMIVLMVCSWEFSSILTQTTYFKGL